MCAACHQNLAPIFSRQVWEETNANPRVAALPRPPAGDGGRERSGRIITASRSTAASTSRTRSTPRPTAANLLGVWQLLWRVGCGDGAAGARCRGAALVAALQYRLTDERAFDERSPAWRDEFLPAFGRAWSARWPAGLAIPNPDVPNRDPLPPEGARRRRGARGRARRRRRSNRSRRARRSRCGPRPGRTPRAASSPASPGSSPRPNPERSTRQLAARAGRERPVERRHEAPCEIAWTGSSARFKCVGAGDAPLRVAGRLDLRGARVAGGEIGALEVDGAPPLEHLEVAAGTLRRRRGACGGHARQPAARTRGSPTAPRSRGIALAWKPAEARARGGVREVSARATVTAIDDFAPVRSAVAALAAEPGDDAPLAARAFSRARVLAPLFAQLGVPAREWCCEDARALPAAVVEAPEPPMPVGGAAAPFAAFYPLCASCHATAERSPPNFLAGPPERVAASVKHCAPRIYARLALWGAAPAARDKTPMPPALPSARGEAYEPAPAIAGLERTASELVRAESGAAPRLDALLANGYEALRPCLPG